MIKYIEHKEIDKKKWDECITNSVNGFIFAYSWYLDSVCENWDALIEDDYQAVFPLPWKKKLGISFIYQPFFLNQLGVFSPGLVSEELVDQFLDSVPKKFEYVDTTFNCQNKAAHPDFQITTREVQYIELHKDYRSIAGNYSENLKRNLKKAEKNNLKAVKNISPEKVVESFKLAQGKNLKVFGKKNYLQLTGLIKKLMSMGMVETIGIYTPDNILCASASFMKSHNRIIYLKGGATDKGKDIGAMHYLMDHVIKQNAGSKLVFDFGGSVVESLARFNKSFGAKEYVYLQARKNNLPKVIKWLKELKK